MEGRHCWTATADNNDGAWRRRIANCGQEWRCSLIFDKVQDPDDVSQYLLYSQRHGALQLLIGWRGASPSSNQRVFVVTCTVTCTAGPYPETPHERTTCVISTCDG